MNSNESILPGKGLRIFFVVLFAVLAFTGVGQMPIFTRYYVAEIPGLGWSGDFYLTHTIHYLGATLLLALVAYLAAHYLLTLRRAYSLSLPGLVRTILLAGLVMTGVMRVFKNLPQVTFPPSMTMFIDISHLLFMILFLLAAAGFRLTRQGWLNPRA